MIDDWGSASSARVQPVLTFIENHASIITLCASVILFLFFYIEFIHAIILLSVVFIAIILGYLERRARERFSRSPRNSSSGVIRIGFLGILALLIGITYTIGMLRAYKVTSTDEYHISTDGGALDAIIVGTSEFYLVALAS